MLAASIKTVVYCSAENWTSVHSTGFYPLELVCAAKDGAPMKSISATSKTSRAAGTSPSPTLLPTNR